MNVLQTCMSQSWGGMEMYALQTAKQLLNRGINAEILCYPGSRIHQEATKENFTTHTSNASGYFHPSGILAVSGLLSQKKYDIIQCGGSKDLWLIVPALKLKGLKTPLILSKQMGSYIVKKDFLHKLIYNRVTYALAISRVIAKNLADTTPLSKDKILLLHNSIDTKKFDPLKIDGRKIRNEFGVTEEDILIGMIARFSPGKGHEEFLYAANELMTKHKNVKFMIVGEPSKGEDKYAEEIKALASQLGILEKIIFTGYRSDTPNVLAALDIFVFPSHAEAFGIALAEALSMAKPSVCSNSDGVLDIAVNGETSFLFEKQNWKDLSTKTEQLIVNPELREKFGKAARQRAVKMFDIEVFTDKLIDIYNSLLV
jgi:glycosyltransferase involved in cell wall biosynthesis